MISGLIKTNYTGPSGFSASKSRLIPTWHTDNSRSSHGHRMVIAWSSHGHCMVITGRWPRIIRVTDPIRRPLKWSCPFQTDPSRPFNWSRLDLPALSQLISLKSSKHSHKNIIYTSRLISNDPVLSQPIPADLDWSRAIGVWNKSNYIY